MYSFIEGSLETIHPAYLIIANNGIGYKIFIAPNTFENLPKLNETTRVYTSQVIRENFQALYGFLTTQEREAFEVLIAISGIGPKIALAILGHLGIEKLKEALMLNQESLFTKVPGVGKKMASRLFIELKDKLPAFQTTTQEKTTSTLSEEKVDLRSSLIHDTLSALMNLGYSEINIKKALQKALQKEKIENHSISTLITSALRELK